MRIGELAQQTDTAAETIRYYEKEGLLPEPARTRNNYRQYGPQHRELLLFIRQCRTLDMSLQEIRVLLTVRDNPAASCTAANQVLDEHIEHVEIRLRELEELACQLRLLRSQCGSDSSAVDCGILQGLACDQLPGIQSRSHVR